MNSLQLAAIGRSSCRSAPTLPSVEDLLPPKACGHLGHLPRGALAPAWAAVPAESGQGTRRAGGLRLTWGSLHAGSLTKALLPVGTGHRWDPPLPGAPWARVVRAAWAAAEPGSRLLLGSRAGSAWCLFRAGNCICVLTPSCSALLPVLLCLLSVPPFQAAKQSLPSAPTRSFSSPSPQAWPARRDWITTCLLRKMEEALALHPCSPFGQLPWARDLGSQNISSRSWQGPEGRPRSGSVLRPPLMQPLIRGAHSPACSLQGPAGTPGSLRGLAHVLGEGHSPRCGL